MFLSARLTSSIPIVRKGNGHRILWTDMVAQVAILNSNMDSVGITDATSWCPLAYVVPGSLVFEGINLATTHSFAKTDMQIAASCKVERSSPPAGDSWR